MAIRPLPEVVEALEVKHAQDQESIADYLGLALFPLWNLVDFQRLDETTPMWVETVIPIIRTSYLQSQRLAAAYAANVRFASLPTAAPMPLIAPNVELPQGVPNDRFELHSFGDGGFADDPIAFDGFPEDDVRTSLLVEGNYNVKAATPHISDESELMAHARANATGAGVRQALKGARNVTNNVIQYDPKALGFARFTDGNPCHFCALLASRGAVYGKHSFAASDAGFTSPKEAPDVPSDFVRVSKVHNHCRCTLRPVYSKSHAFDAEAKFYRKQWNDMMAEGGNVEKRWREQYQVYERTEPDIARIESALREREMALLAEGFDPDSPQVRWAQGASNLLAA
jgi:hypothetical protein